MDGPRRRATYRHGGAVLVNISKARAKEVASEHQRLTTEPNDAVTRPEMARTALATCARCGAVAHGDGTAVPGAALWR